MIRWSMISVAFERLVDSQIVRRERSSVGRSHETVRIDC